MKKRKIGRFLAALGGFSLLLMTGCGNVAGHSFDNKQGDETAYTFAMGTVFTVRVIGQDASNVISEIQSDLSEIDQMTSWRVEASLPALFNKNHSQDMTQIDKMIRNALDVSEKSQGAFDMTVLPLSQLWSFDKMQDADFDPDSMTVPNQKEIDAVLDKIDYTELDYQNGILSSGNEALTIELGAIGKGYALDHAMAIVKESESKGAMISAGSSISLSGTKKDGSMFRVALRDPRGSEEDLLGVITTTDCTITTSGDYERFFEAEGKRYHHILDPRTGYPADSGLMQVTIIGEDGTIGDALSTACFILGLEDGMKLAEQYDCRAIFVDTEKVVWYSDPDILDILDFNPEDSAYTLVEYNQN